MRGDQLSRQWRVLRQIEASKYGLTAEACVLEPESLKDLVKADLRNALSQYTEPAKVFQRQTTSQESVDYTS